MTGRLSALLGAAALAGTLGAAADAHHSFAMFDREKSMTLSGTIRTFEFVNPHVWVWMNVAGNKDPKMNGLWGFEGGGPSQLNRLGFRKTTFKPGDKVTITFYPLKDGRQGGQFRKAILADGSTLDMGEQVKRFAAGVRE